MSNRKGYSGYLIPKDDRDRLLELIPPAYERVYAHHCTSHYGLTEEEFERFCYGAEKLTLMWVMDTGEGIQSVICSINGRHRRVDDNRFHITWSLDPARKKPVDSNKMIENPSSWEDRNGIEVVKNLGFPHPEIYCNHEFFPFH